MKKLAFILLVTFVLLVIGCSSNILDTSDIFSPEDFQTNYDEDKSTFIQLNIDTAFSDSKTVKISGNTITITDKGTYILFGNLDDGMIIVDAGKKDRVHLILDNVHISNKTSSPIYIKQSEKVFITLKENSTNTLSNGGTFITIDESNIDAVIFSKEDLTINGTGTLKISSPEGHGIVSKDSLILTGGTYEIISKYHGLSGKNSICIADADINIISGKDGIHSENKDDNSLGFIYIKNGTYNISSKGDGIAASSKLLIDDGTFKIVNDGKNTNSAADEDDNNNSTSRKGIKSSGSIVINGVFFGSGSSRMPQVFSESKQGFISLKVDTQLAGTKVSLTDIKENKLISSTEPAFDFDFLILSTPFIVKGETYNVTVGSYTTLITAN